MTVQFMNSKDSVKKQLEDAGIEVSFVRPRHTKYDGQILGCSTSKFDTDADFFYVGDGLFHPKALILKNDKTVYTFNPKTNEHSVLTHEVVQSIRKKMKGAYLKFLTSNNIGVLLTLKPGQAKYYMAKNLEKQYPDKNFYFFADNSYKFPDLANFTFIDCFLNTMCERIGYDDMDVQGLSILNIEDLWYLREEK